MKALLLFGCAGILAMAGCGQSKGIGGQPVDASAAAAGVEYVAPNAAGIRTMQVHSSPVPAYLDLPARIEADPTRVVHVYPPAGGRILEMKVRPWDTVQKGETLAVIESSDLSRAVADYHKARSDNEVKQEARARAQDLLEHNAISEREYQQAQADAQMAQADLAAAAEQIRVFGMDPEHAGSQLRVTAPRSGVVLDVAAAPGEFSTALAAPAPLATIADIRTVWAVGDLYEKDLATVRRGQIAQVTLAAYPGEQWTGRVSAISDAVDQTTRTLQLRVALANSFLPGGEPRLKPSMFGTIRLTRSSATGIVVPATAVVREGESAFVFVGEGNGRFERRSVKLGRAIDGTVEIASGLTSGETIVSEGSLLLRSAGQE